MIGAITGDVIGSIYEFNNIKSKDFPLFSPECYFTDDSVMTCAVADAIMEGGTAKQFVESMKRIGRHYPNAGYGGRFFDWLFSDSVDPYNSYGNGSAMRVSPCAWLEDPQNYSGKGPTPESVRNLACTSSIVTHNHAEGIKGAQATADAIFLARYYFGGYSDEKADEAIYKQKIKDYITDVYGYDLTMKLDDIRPWYKYDITCQGTVPQAIIAFLEATDYEDAIRNAISIGGDSDTMGAITGGIAEAAYGVPDWIKARTRMFLSPEMNFIIDKWNEYRKKDW